ncbi:MAG: nicotinamide riboside transporter PnuC [Muribaculaceae bacterium]|nr:nicotinamide riboside transporter PnuC [Muribaculaceae bacterium]
MNYLEISGVIIGLIYLWLEYRASAWLWLAGIIMPAIYIFVYYDAGLYADLWISVYYILASIYGAVCWLRENTQKSTDNRGCSENLKYHNDNKDNSKGKGIIIMRRKVWLPMGVIAICLTLLIGYILSRFTDSNVPWADGFTTALSVVAMWMLAQKYLQQWIVWIIADVACAILYFYKDLWFTGGLYLLYSVIAVLGYRKWHKLAGEQI